jgi:hypothetical protein
MATIPTTLFEPIRVADLPLPPDLATMMDKIWNSGDYTARERAWLEDDFKLRYHYAGHSIVATADPRLLIHAIDLENPDEVHEIHERLHSQGHRNVLCLFPTRWDDPMDQFVTLNAES